MINFAVENRNFTVISRENLNFTAQNKFCGNIYDYVFMTLLTDIEIMI